MPDEAPKSALELAMERLRKKDAESGVADRPITDEQRKAIADVRRVYEARFAEREILHQADLRKTADPEARQVLDDEHQRERERIASERDRKLEQVRRGDGAA